MDIGSILDSLAVTDSDILDAAVHVTRGRGKYSFDTGDTVYLDGTEYEITRRSKISRKTLSVNEYELQSSNNKTRRMTERAILEDYLVEP